MRELKFRAWDSSEKQLVHWPELIRDPDYWLIGLLEREDEEDILMQYTGLLDKNGNEIYEGDIMKGCVYSEYWDEDIGEVKFGEYESDNSGEEYSSNICYGWYIEPIEGFAKDNKKYDRSFLPNHLEIIGNIYENPELLSKK